MGNPQNRVYTGGFHKWNIMKMNGLFHGKSYLWMYIMENGWHKSVPSINWMVYFVENPMKQWMRTGGIPILRNHHVEISRVP